MKKKGKRYDSKSETSSSSDSSNDDSSSRRKNKKRKHKRRRSSHSDKKHKQRVSSHHEDEEEDHYPVPANTSASFINEKQTLVKLIDGENRVENRRLSHEKSREGRFEDDPFTPSPQIDDRKVRVQHEYLSGLNGRDKDTYRDRRRSEDDHRTQQELCSRITSCRKDSSSSAYSETSRKSDSRDFDFSKYNSRTSDSRNSHSSGSRRSDSFKSVSYEGSEVREGNDVNDRRLSSSDASKASEKNQKKNLPTNLLDIFNQIAEFEKEKKQKK